jgi:signal transduction histidine kinase
MALALLKQIPAPEHIWLALVRAVERLSLADNLTKIIEIMRATTHEVSGVDGVCFVIRDGDFSRCVEENAIGPLWKGQLLPLSACVSGWCMQHNQAAVIPDIYRDPRVVLDTYRDTFVRSMVIVPVRTNEMTGAIGCYWTAPRLFSDEEVSFIEAMDRAASVAIAASQLRETLRDQHRLSLAVEAGAGGWELNLANGEFTATASCKAIFGRTPEQPLTAAEILSCLHPDDRERAARLFEAMLEPDTAPWCLRLNTGDTRLEIHRRMAFDVSERPCCLSGTVRKLNEAAKEDAPHPDMLRTARLNDLGQMASALAHELDQPLAAAGNYMHAAERLLGQDAERALAAIGKAEMQFKRAKSIIQRIRGFVGQTGSTKTAENLAEAFAEVLELAKASLRFQNIAVRIEIEEQLPPARIDKIQIQQVMLNLLRNAFEALAQASRQEVVVSARRQGAEIEIHVADSGPGLLPELQGRLFEPVQSTKKGGMGVGLSLCRKIVEAHDGRIWHKDGNPGAIFCFTVPVAQ